MIARFRAVRLPLLAAVGAAGLTAVVLPFADGASAQNATQGGRHAQVDMNDLMGVMERVRAEYVDQVDEQTLIRGAIEGMLSSLDPHSGYLDASDFDNLTAQTDGNYGGLGLTVQMEDGAVKVVAATEDTPASRAGIKSGDYITRLNGTMLYGGTLDDAVGQMRGPAGTPVRLTIVRAGRDAPFDVNITREVIQLRPVKWEVKDDIGIINVVSFSNRTGEAVEAAIAGIDRQLGRRPLGYVVDLRSNPGGLLPEAIKVSDAFLERGEVVSQRGRRPGEIDRYYARSGDATHGLPIIVLIDAGSASAAEIVAGALQDHGRALVMGERSFGKGSVQSILPLSRQSALRLTTARYYLPSGRSVQEGGIQPDIAVPQLSDPDYKTRPRFREADLRRHLINEAKVEDGVLEEDDRDDPRFSMTAEQLEARGIEDFQLHYALDTLKRLARVPAAAPARVAARR